MSIEYPTSLDTLSNPTSTDLVENSNPLLDHDRQHSDANDAIEALEAKVGVDSSAVTTSHDYKLGEVTSTDKAVGKTATQTLTNKTLTSPTLTTPTIASFTNATHDHSNAAGGGTLSATTALGSGTVPTARLGSGTANSSTFLRGDQTWASTSLAKNAGVGSGNIATDQTITIAHGLGTTPSYVRITFLLTSTNANFSFTQIVYVNGGQTAMYMTTEGGTSTSASQDFTARLVATVGGGLTFTTITIQAPDATNIAFATVKSNSPTGTYYYQWEAFV